VLIDIPIPKWARWVAQDDYGNVIVYEYIKPFPKNGAWLPAPYDRYEIITRGTPPADWTKTLKRVER